MNEKYKKGYIEDMVDDFIYKSPIIKVAAVIAASFLGLYILSHFFNISAGTIRAYRNMNSAIKGL